MRKKFTFLSLFMLLLFGRAMAQSVELTFNEGLNTSYKLKFTVIEETNECSVKVSRPATQLTPLEIPTKVTINSSDYYVTEIDSIAFRNNSKFSSVTLPDSLKIIRGKAFYNCTGLTGDLIIPDNVTYIGESAFYGCYNMKGTLKLSEDLVTIGQYAFSRSSSNNTNMGFSGSLVIPNKVKTIGHYAFNYCTNLKGSLDLPESLTSIGDRAFYYCSGFTGDLIIPKNVKTIGSYAFYYCTGFNGELVLPNGLTSIGSCAFTTDASYTSMNFTGSLVIPNSVTSIGSYAFYNAGFDGDLILSENLTSISNYTFFQCRFKGNLRIPNSVTTIGSYAFYNCSYFDGDLSLPASLQTINSSAFYGCSNFNIMYCYAATPPTASSSAFTGHSISILYVPEESYDTYWETSPWADEFFIMGLFKIEDYEVEVKDDNNNVLYSLIYNTTDDYSGVSVRIGQKPTAEVELVIPETLWYVEENFTYNVTTIPAEAFKDCSYFTGVEIPKYVNNIGEHAFAGCSNISIIKSLNPIPPSAADNSFRNATARVAASSFDGIPTTAKLFVLPNYMDYYDIEPWYRFEIKPLLIDYEEFYYEGNSYYTLLFNLNEDYNSLSVKIGRISGSPKTLSIPNSVYDFDVTNIEDKAFYYEGGGYWNDEGNYVYTWSFENLTLPNNLTHIGDSAFYNCYKFNSNLNIPNSVTYIGNYAFRECYNFTGLSFEENSNLETIGNYAFYNCYGFNGNLSIPNSVTSIGNNAFYNCYGFTGNLNIPNSVTSIGNYAFYYCRNFTGLSFEENSNLLTIGDYAFASNNSSYPMGFTGNLNIPNSVTYIGEGAFYYCNGFTGNLNIPNSVTSIGNSAFFYCNKFTGLTFEENSKLETIGNSAFYECNKFTGELIIPNSVTSIGNSAFYYCRNFTGLSFDENSNLLTIGNSAFYYCYGFTGNLNIPNSVTSIGNYAFYNCNKFTGELIIPNSVTSIGSSAFSSNNFSRVICYSTSPASFTGDESIFTSSTIYVPAVSVEAYKAAWKKDASRFDANGLPTFLGGDIDDANNWYVLEDGSQINRLPNANEEIAINAALNINNGEMLNVKSLGYCENGDLTLKEGGQLKCNKHYSDIKVEKSIGKYESLENTSWSTISSPLASAVNPSEITNLTSGSYDLYRYDEPSAVWQNYKNTGNDFTSFEAGRGYLYANSDNTTLIFEGKSEGASSVSYELTKDSETKPGFHLIGNPYTHNITMDNITSFDGETPLYKHLTIELRDSANDGWDGDIAALQIISKNDESIIQSYTLTEGNYAKYELEISYKPIIIKWKRGNNDNEDSFVIKNELGETILSYSTNMLGSIANGTVLYESTSTTNSILAEGYYSLSNEGAWGVKFAENTEIKPCQGVLVKTTEASHLSINSEAPQTRSAKRNVSNYLAVTVSNSKYEDKAYISFNEGVGLDKMAHENENIPMVYIPGNDTDWAIAIKDKNFKEMPLNFEAGSMGEYTISITQKECGFNKLYLHDKVTGQTINILENDYTFFATASENPDRFVIKTVNDEVLENFTYINNNNLIIGNIKGNANIEIFDVLGRKVLGNNCSDDEYQVATDRFTAGVYIIRKTDDNGIKTQKVVID